MEKTCNICGKIGDEDTMTPNGYYHRKCYYQKYHKGKKQDRKKRERDDLPSYYGKVYPNPGEWDSKQQEEDVAWILKTIGWKKSKEGHWYDGKIRGRSGEWLKYIPTSRFLVKNYEQSKYTKFIKENDMKLPTVRYKSKRPYFTDEEIDYIQDQYFNHQVTSTHLADKFNCDLKEVRYITTRTYTLIKELYSDEEINGTHKSAT
jgi:hypothetical protein